MKTKAINYEEIKTTNNEEQFVHGEITFKPLNRVGMPPMVSAKIEAGLTMLESEMDSFTEEINNLFQKYAK